MVDLYQLIKIKNKSFAEGKIWGIVLCFKTHLADKINMIETDIRYIMSFTVDHEKPKTVLLGIVYFPPENSSYCIWAPITK